MFKRIKKLAYILLLSIPYLVGIWLLKKYPENLTLLMLCINFGFIYSLALVIHLQGKYGSDYKIKTSDF